MAGTEEGVTEPEATFSACFGGAFLMWHPMKYASMLAEKMAQHDTHAWLVNTGWSGGRWAPPAPSLPDPGGPGPFRLILVSQTASPGSPLMLASRPGSRQHRWRWDSGAMWATQVVRRCRPGPAAEPVAARAGTAWAAG